MRGLSVCLLAAGLAALPAAALANPWDFEAPVDVTAATGERIFHHLESAGRRNIVVSEGVVAIAWEDDRDGTPRVYLARKPVAATEFGGETRISGPGEAYEPALVALADGRLALAWEEEGSVHLRVVDGEQAGPILAVPASESVQPSLAVLGDDLVLVAAEREGRFPRIVMHRFDVSPGLTLTEAEQCPVDPAPPQDEQLYPAATVQAGQLVVAWEDRRPGHTIIMAATSPAMAACDFTPAARISWRDRPGSGSGTMRNMPYGKGHGVSRVALAPFGEDAVFAAWADKRNFREGYDIWGAAWRAGEGFGENERVQDDFGGLAQQWHATVAGRPDGTVVVAWDDERDGNPSVVMSWREDGVWSDDILLPGAGGPGDQAHPSIVLDADGHLHAAWIEREETGAPTRLRYAFGRAGE